MTQPPAPQAPAPPPTPDPGSAQPGKRYYALQGDDDPTPYALAALNADGLPERFVPGTGFVDWPALAGALLGFDPSEAREARQITEEQANALMAQNVGALPADYVAANRGQPDGNPQAAPLEPDDNPTLGGRGTGTGAPSAPEPPASGEPSPQ